MYLVQVYRSIDGWAGSWTIVGQYRTRKEADTIAADYRSHGERVRVTVDE